MNKNKLIYVIVALAFVAIGIQFGVRAPTTDTGSGAAPTAAAPAPASASAAVTLPPVTTGQADPVAMLFALSLPDSSGKTVQLGSWKGKALVVNFWATWCAPCVDEMPELSALQTEIAPKNAQVLGIGIDSATNIAEFASKYKIAYPLYVAGMDATGLARDFGNLAGGLPFTVLIGADGKIRKTYLGRLKMEELRHDLSVI